MSEEVRVVVPENALNTKTLLGDRLYDLSKRLAEKNPEKQSHGLLGGEFGYGQDFENEVFMMHPYCWCDQEGCKWCSEGAPNFEYKKTGFFITWYKYIGRGMEMESKNTSSDELNKMFDECVKSLEEKS